MKSYTGFALAATLLAVACGGGGESGGGTTTTTAAVFSGSWNCGTQQQCAIVMGAASGCREFTTLSACQVFFTGTTFGSSCGTGACSPTTPGGGGTLSSIAAILNGPNAAGQTSYWNIPSLGNNSFQAATRLALFGDGTGKLISVNNNCLVPLDRGAEFPGQAPVVTNFTWTATGTAALTFTNAAYRCLFNTDPASPNPNNTLVDQGQGALQSLSNISGGTSSATFTGTFVQGSSSGGSRTGTLVSGTL